MQNILKWLSIVSRELSNSMALTEVLQPSSTCSEMKLSGFFQGAYHGVALLVLPVVSRPLTGVPRLLLAQITYARLFLNLPYLS